MKEYSKIKNNLLKSGIPFELEIGSFLVANGVNITTDYAQLREDESGNLKEFSYDLSGTLANGKQKFNFIIECKYHTSSCQWIFMPEKFTRNLPLTTNEFIHSPMDLLLNREVKNINKKRGSDEKWKKVLKGVEIKESSAIDYPINRAVNQVTFPLFEELLSSIKMRAYFRMTENTEFHFIPIIVTNADLFVLNNDISINQIEKSKDINEIATEENILRMTAPRSLLLSKKNQELINEFEQNWLLDKVINKDLKIPDMILRLQLLSMVYPKEVLIFKYREGIDPFEYLIKKLKKYK